MSVVNSFLLSMERYYREYDSSAFIQNSKGALNGKFEAYNGIINAEPYTKALNDAASDLEDIWIDARALKDFNQAIASSPRFDSIGMVPAMLDTNIRTNLNYVKDYNKNITVNMNSLISGNPLNAATFSSITSALMNDKLVDSVKRNAVKSTENIYDLSPKQSMMPASAAPISCTKEYITQQVIPFASNFASLKSTTLTEIAALKDIIVNSAVPESNARVRAAATFCKERPESCKDINKCLYCSTKGLLDVFSFVTYALLRKVHAIKANAITCNKVLELLNSTSGVAKSILTEGVLTDSMISDNIGDLADQMVQNNPAAYIDIANRVYDFHKGIVRTMVPPSDDIDNGTDSFISSFDYEHEPYNTTLEIMTVLGKSFDTMNASLEDVLLVFDDLINRAGLVGDVAQRYKERVAMISDTTKYDSATTISTVGNGDKNIYFVMLHELKDVPKNMANVATAVSDMYVKIDLFEKRLSTNVNGEFKNAAIIEELKVFMTSFREQFKNLVNQMAGEYMVRLRKIALDAEKISANIEEKDDEPLEVTECISDMDIESELDKLQYEYESGITDIIMESMLDIFQAKMMEKNRHMKLITEVAVNTQAGAGNNQNQNNQQNVGTNQGAAAQAKGDAAASAKNKLENLQNKIIDQFQKLVDSFVQKMQLNKIKAFLDANRELLTSTDWNNQPISMLPYENMQWEEIQSDLDALTRTATSIKPGDVSSLNSYAAVYNRLCQNKGGLNVREGADLAACGKQAAEKLRTYYKVKGNRLAVKNYNGSATTNQVKAMVDSLDQYVNTAQESIVGKVNALSSALKDMSSSFTQPMNESVDFIMNYLTPFFEADEDTTPQVGTPTPAAGASTDDPKATGSGFSSYDLMNTVQMACRVYTGAVFNAVRDRVKDYLLVLGKLSKTNTQGMVGAEDNNTQEGNENQQENNA